MPWLIPFCFIPFQFITLTAYLTIFEFEFRIMGVLALELYLVRMQAQPQKAFKLLQKWLLSFFV